MFINKLTGLASHSFYCYMFQQSYCFFLTYKCADNIITSLFLPLIGTKYLRTLSRSRMLRKYQKDHTLVEWKHQMEPLLRKLSTSQLKMNLNTLLTPEKVTILVSIINYYQVTSHSFMDVSLYIGDKQSFIHITGELRWGRADVLPVENIFPAVGRSETLDCNVKGEPNVTVTWYLDGSPILENDGRMKGQEVSINFKHSPIVIIYGIFCAFHVFLIDFLHCTTN